MKTLRKQRYQLPVHMVHLDSNGALSHLHMAHCFRDVMSLGFTRGDQITLPGGNRGRFFSSPTHVTCGSISATLTDQRIWHLFKWNQCSNETQSNSASLIAPSRAKYPENIPCIAKPTVLVQLPALPELHGLGALRSQLTTDYHFHSFGAVLHDEPEAPQLTWAATICKIQVLHKSNLRAASKW